ncbi:hypothetical protein ONE63_008477 [Megalurothrips usitatus]|uniref:G patch domain-containing protein 4 n=1 Tax=Megalurothrips usitatus TaxID=439358 RepID=A0AAV7XQF4_9NEOP|nr:hypothetical protein ONE63_008477 [Megalurothrips usitatus]
MDFARRQLEKYGWKDGKGLGKDLTGISQPLKPGVKLNQCGIGYDLAEEFTHHWWEDAFNNACSNISIEQAQDGIKVATTAPPSEISAVKRAQIERDRLQYGSFIKRETMTKSGSILAPEERNDPIEEAKNKLTKLTETLTDEQLFEACGRLTAHKGARHGLTLSGKLQRVKEQEEAFLKAYQSPIPKERPRNNTGSENRKLSEPCEELVKKKKKKKKNYDEKESSVPESFTKETGKKKKKHALEEEPRKVVISEELSDNTELTCDIELTKKSKKKRRHSVRDDDQSSEKGGDQAANAEFEEPICEAESAKIKKKKKRRKSESDTEEQLLVDKAGKDTLEDVCEDTSVKSKKKKKKSRD